MANTDRTKALALELQQIILADRMAADTLRTAEETKHNIEKNAERQQANILADAEKRKQEVTELVRAEQTAALEKRKQETEKQFAAQRTALEARVAESKDTWIAEIVERICTV